MEDSGLPPGHAESPAGLFGPAPDEADVAGWRDEAEARGLATCDHCGRPVPAGEGWLTTVLAGGDVVAAPWAVSDEDAADAGQCGTWLLAPSCALPVPLHARVRAGDPE